MRLKEIDETTEDTFFRCLHDELPDDPRVTAMRRHWRATHQPKGHRAKVLLDDDDLVVGLTNYIPVEHSPYVGDNLMAILCMWIHGYEHGVGNQQSQGYGRFMLGEIEADARRSGCDGVTVWAKDYNAWNPVSFYEHMGYTRADLAGLDVLVWKAFNARARAPALLKPKPSATPAPPATGKVQVTNISNGWCGGGCHQCMMVRDATADLSDRVELTQIYAHDKADMERYVESFDVVYVDGEPFLPDGPPTTPEQFRKALLARFAIKNAR